MIGVPILVMILEFIKSQDTVSYKTIQAHLRCRGVRLSIDDLVEDLKILKSLGFVSIPIPGFYRFVPE